MIEPSPPEEEGILETSQPDVDEPEEEEPGEELLEV